MRVEALSFDGARAGKTETALPTVFRGVIVRGQFSAGRRGEEEKLSIGENAVHVKEKQLDFLGARLGIGHSRIVAMALGRWLLALPSEERQTWPREAAEFAKALRSLLHQA